MKLLIAKVQAQASRPIELGAALDSNFVFPSSKSLRSQQWHPPRTSPSHETGPFTKPWMALPSGCIAGLQRLGIFISQPEKHL